MTQAGKQEKSRPETHETAFENASHLTVEELAHAEEATALAAAGTALTKVADVVYEELHDLREARTAVAQSTGVQSNGLDRHQQRAYEELLRLQHSLRGPQDLLEAGGDLNRPPFPSLPAPGRQSHTK